MVKFVGGIRNFELPKEVYAQVNQRVIMMN